MLPEPWNTALFLIAIPILVQLYKLYKSQGGPKPEDWVLQLISFVLSGLFVYFSGGFAGVDFPVFPLWSGDFVAFLGDLLNFLGAVVAVISVAFGTITGLYEVVFKRIYKLIGFAPS